jgi:5-hydroxyisourate hydrolase-like protein (transthyretin family)
MKKVLVFQGKPAVMELALSQMGAVGGQVTNAATKTPVEGITVRLWDASWKLAATVKTDSAGTYRMEGVPSGAYHVSIDVPAGFVAEQEQNAVLVGSGIIDVVFHLRPSHQLSGRVVDDQLGSPLAGIEVEVCDRSGRRLAVGKTTQMGDYQFLDLPEDDYWVKLPE